MTARMFEKTGAMRVMEVKDSSGAYPAPLCIEVPITLPNPPLSSINGFGGPGYAQEIPYRKSFRLVTLLHCGIAIYEEV